MAACAAADTAPPRGGPPPPLRCRPLPFGAVGTPSRSGPAMLAAGPVGGVNPAELPLLSRLGAAAGGDSVIGVGAEGVDAFEGNFFRIATGATGGDAGPGVVVDELEAILSSRSGRRPPLPRPPRRLGRAGDCGSGLTGVGGVTVAVGVPSVVLLGVSIVAGVFVELRERLVEGAMPRSR